MLVADGQTDRQTDTEVSGCGFLIIGFFFLLCKESLKNGVPYMYVVVIMKVANKMQLYRLIYYS